MPRVLWGSHGGGRFLMGEVLLYGGLKAKLNDSQPARLDADLQEYLA